MNWTAFKTAPGLTDHGEIYQQCRYVSDAGDSCIEIYQIRNLIDDWPDSIVRAGEPQKQ